MKSWIKPLEALDACEDALVWCEGYDSLDEAWGKCERGDWMLWLAGRFAGEPGSDSRKTLVLAACACARLALPYIPRRELRPLRAIETAEAWAQGKEGVTLEDVRTAAHAVAYTATAAYAHAVAAYAAHAAYAAYAAAYTATAAYAHAVAAYAAYAYAAYATATISKTTLAQCADIVRQFYPNPPESR